jgi:hypothetical protein
MQLQLGKDLSGAVFAISIIIRERLKDVFRGVFTEYTIKHQFNIGVDVGGQPFAHRWSDMRTTIWMDFRTTILEVLHEAKSR